MTADDQLRERLASALPETLGPAGLRHAAVPALGLESSITEFGRVLVDALLPVVREYADQQAAEELRKAAETMVDPIDRYKLRGRATLIEHGEDPDREVRVAAREQQP